MEFSQPQAQHRFLERLLGEWLYLTTSHPGYDPDDPAKRWTETVRSLGGLWVIGESRGPMPDGRIHGMVITLGYDARLGHYVGSWVGSMMDTLWLYKGWVEPDGKTLTLESEGPAFDDPQKIALYHDVVTFKDDDHRSFTGSVRQPDGSFKTFMQSEMKRIG